MAKKKQNQKETPKVNPELEGFDIRIDPFGEIKTNYNIDKINEFLNKNVDDKKLRERDGKYVEEGEGQEEPDEDQLIENQLEEIVEDELENDDLETDADSDPEEDFKIEDDFDGFTIEDDDDLK